MNPQAGTLWTRGLLLCWILLLFVKQSCSNSSLGGDCINLLLLGECLFKIQIAANHHPPRFLLMPLKLSVKLGDDLHLRNFLNIYYCSVLCLRWGGRSVAGCVRGEAVLAPVTLWICLENVLFFSDSDKGALGSLVYVCPVLHHDQGPGWWPALKVSWWNLCGLCWCSYGPCWEHGRKSFSTFLAFGTVFKTKVQHYHSGKGGLL